MVAAAAAAPWLGAEAELAAGALPAEAGALPVAAPAPAAGAPLAAGPALLAGAAPDALPLAGGFVFGPSVCWTDWQPADAAMNAAAPAVAASFPRKPRRLND